jgi:hypothetical protein
MKIVKFIKDNGNTDIMILGMPHRCDLVGYSCDSRRIQPFNYKLKKVVNSFNYVTVMECNYNREYFTKHDMHLHRRGKQLGLLV